MPKLIKDDLERVSEMAAMHPRTRLLPPDAALYLGMSTQRLCERVEQKTGPKHIPLGTRSRIFLKGDLDEWLENRRANPGTIKSTETARDQETGRKRAEKARNKRKREAA